MTPITTQKLYSNSFLSIDEKITIFNSVEKKEFSIEEFVDFIRKSPVKSVVFCIFTSLKKFVSLIEPKLKKMKISYKTTINKYVLSLFSIEIDDICVWFKDLTKFDFSIKDIKFIEKLNEQEEFQHSFSLPSYGFNLFKKALLQDIRARNYYRIFPTLDKEIDDIFENKTETDPYLYHSEYKGKVLKIDFRSFYPFIFLKYKFPYGKVLHIENDVNKINELVNTRRIVGDKKQEVVKSYDYIQKNKTWPGLWDSFPFDERYFYYTNFKLIKRFPFKTFDFLDFEESTVLVTAEILDFITEYINKDDEYVDFTIIRVYEFKNRRMKDNVIDFVNDLYEQRKELPIAKKMLNGFLGHFGFNKNKKPHNYFPLHRTLLMLAKVHFMKFFWKDIIDCGMVYANTDEIWLKFDSNRMKYYNKFVGDKIGDIKMMVDEVKEVATTEEVKEAEVVDAEKKQNSEELAKAENNTIAKVDDSENLAEMDFQTCMGKLKDYCMKLPRFKALYDNMSMTGSNEIDTNINAAKLTPSGLRKLADFKENIHFNTFEKKEKELINGYIE